LIDQDEIHKQCFSEDPEQRIKALESLKYSFPLLPDKQQAWNDLIKLFFDRKSDVHWSSVKDKKGFLHTFL
jgi:hypothetical protein